MATPIVVYRRDGESSPNTRLSAGRRAPRPPPQPDRPRPGTGDASSAAAGTRLRPAAARMRLRADRHDRGAAFRKARRRQSARAAVSAAPPRTTPRDLVELAEEARDEQVGRPAVESRRRRRPAPGCPARISAMRSAMRIASSGSCVTIDAGHPALAQHMQRVLAHLVAQAAVEAGERLVHQQHARARRHRARQRHALLLAARQHVRIGVGVVRRGRRGRARAAPRARLLAFGSAFRPNMTLARWSDAGTARSPGTSARRRAAPAARTVAARRPRGR